MFGIIDEVLSPLTETASEVTKAIIGAEDGSTSSRIVDPGVNAVKDAVVGASIADAIVEVLKALKE